MGVLTSIVVVGSNRTRKYLITVISEMKTLQCLLRRNRHCRQVEKVRTIIEENCFSIHGMSKGCFERGRQTERDLSETEDRFEIRTNREALKRYLIRERGCSTEVVSHTERGHFERQAVSTEIGVVRERNNQSIKQTNKERERKRKRERDSVVWRKRMLESSTIKL